MTSKASDKPNVDDDENDDVNFVLQQRSFQTVSLSTSNSGIYKRVQCTSDETQGNDGVHVKATFVGAGAVGKTELFRRMILGLEFNGVRNQTIANDVVTIHLKTRHPHYNRPTSIMGSDTAGQKEFIDVARSSLAYVDVVFVVFDAANDESLSVADRWVDRIGESAPQSVIVALIASRCDLYSSDTLALMNREIGKMAKERNMAGGGFVVSSKTSKLSVFNEILVSLVDMAIDKRDSMDTPLDEPLKLNAKAKAKKSFC